MHYVNQNPNKERMTINDKWHSNLKDNQHKKSKDKNDIDADDNGHYTIFTKDGRMTNGSGEYIE